jgi:hypothetical protein
MLHHLAVAAEVKFLLVATVGVVGAYALGRLVTPRMHAKRPRRPAAAEAF